MLLYLLYRWRWRKEGTRNTCVLQAMGGQWCTKYWLFGGCYSQKSLMCLVSCSYGNSALKTETEMFEKYYSRLEPRDHRMTRLSDIKITAAEFSQVHDERWTGLHPVGLHKCILCVCVCGYLSHVFLGQMAIAFPLFYFLIISSFLVSFTWGIPFS